MPRFGNRGVMSAIQEIETQLADDLNKYQSMTDERNHAKHTLLLQRKPMKFTLLSRVKLELEELQKKYAQLYAQVETQNVKTTE